MGSDDCPHPQLKIIEGEDRRFTLTPFGAVCFLWHFPSCQPWGRQSSELRSTLPCGARTFLPCENLQERSSLENAAAFDKELICFKYIKISCVYNCTIRRPRMAAATTKRAFGNHSANQGGRYPLMAIVRPQTNST